jgi:hypothetical protein
MTYRLTIKDIASTTMWQSNCDEFQLSPATSEVILDKHPLPIRHYFKRHPGQATLERLLP